MCVSCLTQHNEIMYLHETGEMDISIIMELRRNTRKELYEAFQYINSEEFKAQEKKDDEFEDSLEGLSNDELEKAYDEYYGEPEGD